jgi:hypothetical protein
VSVLDTTSPKSSDAVAAATPALHRVLQLMGIDRAVGYTLFGRTWSGLSNLITLFFVIRNLRPDEQGFYYTFSSVLALQVFFELGLAYVLLQTASHEWIYLEWAQDGTLAGDPVAKSRVHSLLRFALLWYGLVAALVVAVVLPSGWYFFSTYSSPGVHLNWTGAWCWLVIATAGNLLISPVLALLEGCGLVARVALVRLLQSVAGSAALWFGLSAGWGLNAVPLFNVTGLLCAIGWLMIHRRLFLLEAVSAQAHADRVSWRREIWPFQWKIAVSWLSGYFTMQLFNPVAFASQGPASAGRVGMTVSVVNGLSILAASWISTKAAPMGGLIARQQYAELDMLFFRSLRQSTAAMCLGAACAWTVDLYLHVVGSVYASRLLEPVAMALFLGSAAVTHIVYCEATYLRAHKKEPFLVLSLLAGGAVAISTVWLGRSFGTTGMAAGYFAVNLVIGLGFGTWIFNHKRKAWHRFITTPLLDR